jgi:hypothetical protein
MVFPSGVSTKTLYTHLLFPIRATCPGYLIHLDLITRTIIDQFTFWRTLEYTSGSIILPFSVGVSGSVTVTSLSMPSGRRQGQLWFYLYLHLDYSSCWVFGSPLVLSYLLLCLTSDLRLLAMLFWYTFCVKDPPYPRISRMLSPALSKLIILYEFPKVKNVLVSQFGLLALSSIIQTVSHMLTVVLRLHYR